MSESVLNTQYGGEHYKGKAIQPIEYAHANNLSFFQGNVVKYVTRYKDKKGAEDIEKAVHYLQMILEFEYGVKTSFKKEEDISEQECVDYHQKLWKEGTIQPQSQVKQEKPEQCDTCKDGLLPWPYSASKDGSPCHMCKAGEALAEANRKPWYPPVEDGGNPWIEWNKGYMPLGATGCRVDLLLLVEQDEREAIHNTGVYANDVDWSLRGDMYDIVAYRVV
jgi:hypothetical protein